MGSLRFRKQFRLAPGVKLTLNKQSVSATLGVRGKNLTYNTKGQRTISVGIPGTGLWWRDTRKVGSAAGTRPAAWMRAASAANFDPIEAMSEIIRGQLWQAVSTTAVAANAELGKSVQWVVPAIVSWEPPRRFHRSGGTLTVRIAGQVYAIPVAPLTLPRSLRRRAIRILRGQDPAYSLWVTDRAGCILVGRYSHENEAFTAERELAAKVRAESEWAAIDAATRAGELDWSTSDVDARRAYWANRLGFKKGNVK